MKCHSSMCRLFRDLYGCSDFTMPSSFLSILCSCSFCSILVLVSLDLLSSPKIWAEHLLAQSLNREAKLGIRYSSLIVTWKHVFVYPDLLSSDAYSVSCTDNQRMHPVWGGINDPVIWQFISVSTLWLNIRRNINNLFWSHNVEHQQSISATVMYFTSHVQIDKLKFIYSAAVTQSLVLGHRTWSNST